MSQAPYRVRRAIIDDLPWLLSLWTAMHLPAPELEKRLTEFQVVESADDELLGALAFEVNGRHARLHSETFSDFGLSEKLRELLWHRMESIAATLGLTRIWTNEHVPFWKQNGFQPPDASTLAKLPAIWSALPGPWLTLELRSEEALRTALEADFSRLKIEERHRTSGARRTAQIIKVIAIILTVIIVAAVIIFCVSLIRHLPAFRRR